MYWNQTFLDANQLKMQSNIHVVQETDQWKCETTK